MRKLLPAIIATGGRDEWRVAGTPRARREGKVLGRPRTSPLNVAAAAQLVAEGASITTAAKQGSVSFETLRRHLRAEASA